MSNAPPASAGWELKNMSHSALSMYAECPRKFALRRVERIPEATWFATLAGRAIHQATEEQDRLEWAGLGFDLDACKARFLELFDEEIAECAARGIAIRASGRESKKETNTWTGGPNKKDYAWWVEFGPQIVEQFFRWKDANGLVLAEIGGAPAIEVELDYDLVDDDGVVLHVKGFIDRLYTRRLAKRYVIFDLKTGRAPDHALQLEGYGVGLRKQHGIDAKQGAFWTPSGTDDQGRVRGPFELHGDEEILAEIYHSARVGIEAGAFPPNTNAMCGSCGVRDYCTAINGPAAKKKLEEWREKREQSRAVANAVLPDNKERDDIESDN